MEENSMNLKRVLCVAFVLTLLVAAPSWAAILNYVDHDTKLDGTFNPDYANNQQQPIATINFNNSAGIETNPASLTDMYARVSNQIFSALDPWGYYGGVAWDGPGYTSLKAATNATGNTTIGINTGAQFEGSFGAGTLFFGATPGANQILIRYTYAGDVNLDGAVDGGDVALLIDGLSGDPAKTGYFYGDMNYDTYVDGGDVAIMIDGLAKQGTELPDWTPPYTDNWPTGGSITPVPEPSTIVLLILACTLGLAARKKFA
jgi:hypothetical protein